MSDRNSKSVDPVPEGVEQDAAIDRDRPFFVAVLTPHRSLGPRGFAVLMAALGSVGFGAGLVFLVLGAWPVFGFLGLDVLLVYLAFRWNYRTARAFEEVQVSATEIAVRKVSHYGKVQEHHFNPFWAKLAIVRLQDEGVVRITLSARGKAVDLGGFLNPDDRTSFAGALQAAMATAKAGGVA